MNRLRFSFLKKLRGRCESSFRIGPDISSCFPLSAFPGLPTPVLLFPYETTDSLPASPTDDLMETPMDLDIILLEKQ